MALKDYADRLVSSKHPRSQTNGYSSASSSSGKESVYSLFLGTSRPGSALDPVMSGALQTDTFSNVSSLVSGRVSSCASSGAPKASSSLSSASVPSVNVPKEGLSENPRAEATIEQPFNRREDINDPQGSTLSLTLVGSSGPSTSPKKTLRIGEYLITLEATELKINRHCLHVNNYDIGLAFFETLSKHPQELDSLNAAICRGDEDWEGISGWVVNPSDWTV